MEKESSSNKENSRKVYIFDLKAFLKNEIGKGSRFKANYFGFTLCSLTKNFLIAENPPFSLQLI